MTFAASKIAIIIVPLVLNKKQMLSSGNIRFPAISLSAIINFIDIRKNRLFILIIVFYITCQINDANAQCLIKATGCGEYTVNISFNPIDIVPNTTNCPFGYNYNVQFAYSVTVSGVNTCYDSNIGIQSQITCAGQNNGNFDFSVPAPIVGNQSRSVTYTGTVTTVSNSYRSATDCNTATPASLNCMNLQMTVFGPGIPATTYPCDFVLPVELISFSGQCEGNNVSLKWSTATETNNDSFSIEHSADVIKWQISGTVAGAGNSSGTRHYSFTDTDSYNGVNYFRLKQKDKNGDYTYSKIIEVNGCNKDIDRSDFIIYPNPAKGVFNLQFNGDNDVIRSIEVINLNGQKIYNSGVFQSDIDLSSLQSGVYFIRVNLETKIITKIIVLER